VKRLLIVDDDPLLAETLRAMVADVAEPELGAQVEVSLSSSARDATRRLETEGPFDAIVCDLAMPGTDGLAFRAQLRAAGNPLADRFALITGGAFSASTAAALERQPLPTLQKPFDADQLTALLRQLLAP